MTVITREYLDSLPEDTILFIRDYIWERFGRGHDVNKKPVSTPVEQKDETKPEITTPETKEDSTPKAETETADSTQPSESDEETKSSGDNDTPKPSTTSASADKRCPNCGGIKYIKWGKDNLGNQRYFCKDCKTTFTDTSNTLLAWNHIPEEVLLKLIDCEIRGDSIKEIAYQTGLNESVVFNMRQRLHTLADIRMSERKLVGLIEMDATYSKINLSGTQPQNMPRFSKKRGKGIKIVGEEHELRGPSHHKICIVTAIDEEDNILYRISGLGTESEEKYNKYGDCFDDGKMIVSDKCQAIINFAENHGMESDIIPVKPGKKYFTTPMGNSLGDVNQLHQEFKDTVRFSHGISTRHLQGYLSWISYTKILHYTAPRGDQARMIYEDLLSVIARLKTDDISTKEQPIDLFEAYGEYHYGIFSDARLASETGTAD